MAETIRPARLGLGLDAPLPRLIRAFHTDAVQCHVGDPVGELQSGEAFAARVIAPLHDALGSFADVLEILIEGDFEGAHFTAASGYLEGVFAAPLWSLPPTGRATRLRYGRFDRWVDGRIAELWLLLDLPALMMEADVWPLNRPLGGAAAPPPPHASGLAPGDEGSAQSLALVEAMIGGLHRFEGNELAAMGMRDFWTDDFGWYGPAPIGIARGHADYERAHQRPFLTAFPDRVGGDHKARFAQGAFVASTGWPSIRATHTGDGWLGLAASGRAVTIRVMDFWACAQGRLAQNWVMIDIPHLVAQIGCDIFAALERTDG